MLVIEAIGFCVAIGLIGYILFHVLTGGKYEP